MRIISGSYGGRVIPWKAPDGTRPTTDKVRGSIFNILSNIVDFEELIVADFFAGTGLLGIEALSRGADNCVFVDNNRKACDCIRKTLDFLKIDPDASKILKIDAIRSLKEYFVKNHIQPDMIFIDPPYKKNLSNKIIEELSSSGIITPEMIIVSEDSIDHKILIPSGMKLHTERIFGETKVEILVPAEWS